MNLSNIDDIEDYYLSADAAERGRKGGERRFSAREVSRDLGSDGGVRRVCPAPTRKIWIKNRRRRIVGYRNERVAPFEDRRALGKTLLGPLSQFWRYRVGDYRIICALHDRALPVLGVRIGK
jgi:mRNA interferase RelE/StbE